MSTAVMERPETWPELPERDGYEYDNGKWVKLAVAAGPTHISFNLVNRLRAYAAPLGLGWALAHETPFQIWPLHPKKYRKPDGAFLRPEAFPDGKVPEGFMHAIPEILIEVISPGDRFTELQVKIDEYFEAGVKLVWVLVSKPMSVLVYRADGTISQLRQGDVLTGETILPGFRVAVADLFDLRVGLAIETPASDGPPPSPARE